MVTFKHEGVLQLVRDRPAFAADLLDELLAVKVPPFGKARLVDVTLNEVVPTEYRADAVVLFSRRKPVFGAIVEAQLAPDNDKRFSWPLYAVGARAREQCPFVVLVLAPNAATARWAARPIELGGGNQYTPLVIGPAGIPKLTDRARAAREPQLAVLSVMAHGRGELKTAVAIGAAAARAVQRLPEKQRLVYLLLIESNLSEAARKAIEMEPDYLKLLSAAQRRNFERGRAKGKAEGKAKGRAEGKAEGRAEGKAEGRAEGRAEGKAEGVRTALLTILARRGLTPTLTQRRRIVGCADVSMLERWLDRAFSVASVEELLSLPARLRRGVGDSSRSPRVNGRRKSA